MAEPTQWSDGQKWLADLAKNVITFGLISVATIFWIDERTADRDRARFEQQKEWQAYFEKRSAAITNFSLESSLYLNAMDDAFLVAFNGNAYLSTHEKYAALNQDDAEKQTDYGRALLEKWHDHSWAKMESAMNEMQGWFSRSDAVVKKVSEMKDILFELDKEFDSLRKKKPKGIQRGWYKYRTGNQGYGKIRADYEKTRAAILSSAIETLYNASGSAENEAPNKAN